MTTYIPAKCTFSESQHVFLNPEACRLANPYGITFWQDIQRGLSAVSDRAAAYPKAAAYRYELEPYLFQKVHMTADKWSILDGGSGCLRILLEDLHLTHACGSVMGSTPNVYTDHMNIQVSVSWLNRVVPDPLEPLAISGILYEYASSRGIRNIKILPVLIAPKSRKVGSRKNISYFIGPSRTAYTKEIAL